MVTAETTVRNTTWEELQPGQTATLERITRALTVSGLTLVSRTTMAVPARLAIDTGQTISRPSSSSSGFAICATQASSMSRSCISTGRFASS